MTIHGLEPGTTYELRPVRDEPMVVSRGLTEKDIEKALEPGRWLPPFELFED